LQIAEIYLSMGRVPVAKRILMKVGRGKTYKGNFLRELTRLTQAANSIQQHAGGFSEQISSE
jgi:hypothetical protein